MSDDFEAKAGIGVCQDCGRTCPDCGGTDLDHEVDIDISVSPPSGKGRRRCRECRRAW